MMRETDIIRLILDLLDQKEAAQECPPTAKVEINVPNETGEQTSRFKQIFAMLSNPSTGQYSNTPNEIIAPMSAVTTDAGGRINGSKHPHDIRVKDPSMYPNQQEY